MQYTGIKFYAFELFCFFPKIIFKIKSVAIIINTEQPRTINTFCTNPEMIYPTILTPATVSAYGSCVETWLTWSHCAPVDAIIVVSEIGEQWSPHTAPARQADMHMITREGISPV